MLIDLGGDVAVLDPAKFESYVLICMRLSITHFDKYVFLSLSFCALLCRILLFLFVFRVISDVSVLVFLFVVGVISVSDVFVTFQTDTIVLLYR